MPSVFASDIGTGVDTGALVAAITGTETGTGADSPSLNASFSIADTGTSVVTLALYVPKTANDTATAADVAHHGFYSTETAAASEVATAPTVNEFGTATEVIDRDFVVGDTASGSEGISDREIAIFIELTATDAAPLLDHALSDNGLSMDEATWGQVAEDAGVGADVATAIPGVSETGTAADSGDLAAAITGADTAGTFEDTTLVVPDLAASDSTGTGTEGTSVEVAPTAGADVGTGSDALGFGPAAIEYPTGTDAGEVAAVVDTAADTGTAIVEEGAVVATLPTAADTGTGSDAASYETAQSAAETASGGEELSPAFETNEYRTGTDAGVADAAIAGDDDTATTVEESGTLAVALSCSDSGTGSDSGTQDADLTASESASGASELLPNEGQDDYAVAADTATVGIAAAETAAGVETSVAPYMADTATATEDTLYGPTLDDYATGVDAVSELVIEADDVGTGSEFGTPAWTGETATADDTAAVTPAGADGVREDAAGTEDWVIDGEIAGDDETLEVYEDALVEASLTASDTGAGDDAGDQGVECLAEEAATGDDGGVILGEPDPYPPEEGVGVEEATVTVEVEAADTATDTVGALALPAGAYFVRTRLAETNLDRNITVPASAS